MKKAIVKDKNKSFKELDKTGKERKYFLQLFVPNIHKMDMNYNV